MTKSINDLPESIWTYDEAVYHRLSEKDLQASLMPEAERKLVNGLLRYYKPKRILELGVALGGGSMVILNAISDMPQSRLISIDIAERYVNNPQLEVGHAALQKHSDNCQWELFPGREPSEIIDKLGKKEKFDFVVMDTWHVHPGESLNFLTILPYLQEGAIVVIQDISLYAMCLAPHGFWHIPLKAMPEVRFAPKLLFDTLAAKKFTLPVSAYSKEDKNAWSIVFPNIGVLQISKDIWNYIGNVFSMLEFPWGGIPEKIAFVADYLSRHYSKTLYKQFKVAFRKNVRLLYHKEVSYCLTANEIDFSEYDKVIFYGCGQFLRDYLCRKKEIFVFPDEIWDVNADAINEGDVSFLQGIPLFSPSQCGTDQTGTAIVIMLDEQKTPDLVNTIKSELEQNGFIHIFRFNDCYPK